MSRSPRGELYYGGVYDEWWKIPEGDTVEPRDKDLAIICMMARWEGFSHIQVYMPGQGNKGINLPDESAGDFY